MHYMVLKVLRSTFKRAQGTRGKPAHGGIAQLVEHLLCKQGVIGSNPFTSTILRMGEREQETEVRERGLIAQLVRAHA